VLTIGNGRPSPKKTIAQPIWQPKMFVKVQHIYLFSTEIFFFSERNVSFENRKIFFGEMNRLKSVPVECNINVSRPFQVSEKKLSIGLMSMMGSHLTQY
jgi:hypothetical protein